MQFKSPHICELRKILWKIRNTTAALPLEWEQVHVFLPIFFNSLLILKHSFSINVYEFFDFKKNFNFLKKF